VLLARSWGSSPVEPAGNMSFADASRFAGQPLFYVGRTFDGLPLVRIDRRATRLPGTAVSPPLRIDYVSFKYGTCDGAYGACRAPLEVQVWPICLRNPSAYGRLDRQGHRVGPPDVAYEALRVRGVPAALYDAGTRLEVYTGHTAVVIFGARERILAAAEALTRVDGDDGRRAPLPSPSPRSLVTNCL